MDLKLEIPLKKRRITLTAPKEVSFDIQTLDDLLEFAWKYNEDDRGIDWFTLWSMIPALTKLNDLIGMEELKSHIVKQIIYFIQNLHGDEDMLHTVICGPPGVGKTTVANILAEIYCKLGILSTNNVIRAKKKDFLGRYIGHTEPKTTELLEKCLGGVLFIDEIYSFGYSSKSEDGPDSFSKSAIDILNQFLYDHKSEFICIIAGYEDDIEKDFFSVNKGLKRRFPIKYKIEPYKASELLQIFKKMARDIGWKITKNPKVESIFEENKEIFQFGGGDMEVLLSCCKMAHSSRIFGSYRKKKYITSSDLRQGFELFKKSRNSKTMSDKDEEIIRKYFS